MASLNGVTTAISQKFTEAKAAATQATLETALASNKPRMMGGAFAVNPTDTIEVAFSGQKLQDECMNDLLSDVFMSRNRIFIVDKELPLYKAKTEEELKQSELDLEAAEKAAPAPAQGGRRRKTRKVGKKKGKKSRRLPFKKR
jgi:hypothetical protein